MNSRKDDEEKKPLFSDPEETGNRYFRNQLFSIVTIAVVMLLIVLAVEFELV